MTDQLPLERLSYWVQRHPNDVWLSQPVNGQWRDLTWAEADDQVRRMATALRALGCEPGDRVAILAKNCAHWIIADLAIMAAGLVSVPLYPSQSVHSIEYVLGHSAVKAVFVGKLDHPSTLEQGLAEGVLRIAMPYATMTADYAWQQLIDSHPPMSQWHEAHPDGLASIIYTSGTTGVPKGVMFSLGAFAWAGSQAIKELNARREQFFSYLPLSHVAERAMVEITALYSGGRVGFMESMETLVRDLKQVRPTVFFSVPRLWLRLQQDVLTNTPQNTLDRLLPLPLLGRFIARKIRKQLGLDRTRFFIGGAAPAPRGLLEWFDDLGMPIYEGYGLTESLAYGTFNRPKMRRIGSVGKATAGVEIRLAEDGEILLRCASLMHGYYRDPEQTALSLKEGWLHTGDKGDVDRDGFLSITGRVKDLFKTNKGKYIAPAQIEAEIAENQLVEQVCLLGVNRDQPMALIDLAANARQLAPEQVEASLLKTLNNLNNQLQAHERISHMLLVNEPWTVANGCMTPTFKIRRSVLEQRFADDLGALDDRHAVRWQGSLIQFKESP